MSTTMDRGSCDECGAPLDEGQSSGTCGDCDDCENGIHSWADAVGKLPPDTKCTHCGEAYGNPD